MNVGKNRKRADVLVSYAAPYRLNIITDEFSYVLVLDHPTTGHRENLTLTREMVDRSPNPEAIIKGHIDAMRRDMEAKYSAGPVILDSPTVNEMEKYADPFDLEIRATTQAGRVSTAIELTIRKVPEYGFKSDIVMVPAGDKLETMRKCLQSIDKMRNELGWKKEEYGMPIQPAQPSKSFILECPDHGGAMAPAEEDVLVCLVPGCKKRARRKYKQHLNEVPINPPAHFNSFQQELKLEDGQYRLTVADIDLADILAITREAFQDAHGHVWQRKQ